MIQSHILFLFIIIFLKCKLNFGVKDKECSLLSPTHFADSDIARIGFNKTAIKIFKNFNDLDELNFNCSMELKLVELIFLPNKEIYLDNTFSYAKLFYSLRFEYNKEISFHKLKGFNHKSNNKIYKYFSDYQIQIENSRFEFYMNETRITDEMCKLANFKNDTNLFGAIQYMRLSTNIYYSKKTCPYVFINSKLVFLQLGHISNSFILKNQLEFVEIDQTNEFSLNNKALNFLSIDLAFENLNLKLINRHVFKYVKKLIIYGVVESIQMDLFLNFKYLNLFCLNLDNLESFLHKSDNSWMKYLNNEVNVNISNESEIDKNIYRSFLLEINTKGKESNQSNVSFERFYLYPNEDFCLFKHFPHHHLVYPLIFTGVKLECTCTIMWLIQNLEFYIDRIESSDYVVVSFYDSYEDFYNHTTRACYYSYQNDINQCNFTERFAYCNKSDYVISKINPLNDLEVLFDIKWVELIVFLFLQPAICAFGLVTNLLSILTLNQHLDLKLEKEKRISKHILMNSIFNFIYCMIFLLKLINVCIFDISPYCSPVYTNESSQYFRIVFIYFLGNVIKLCSNTSYISFALSRFSLTINNENKLLKKFNQLNLKLFYFVTIIVSVLLSLFKLFQYQINGIYNSFKSFPFETYDIGNCGNDDMYCYLFRYLNLLNDFISYFLFFLVNLILDIYLMRNSKNNLENKRKIVKDHLKLITAIKSQKKITKMLLLNGLLFILAYTPELITRILLLKFEKNLYNFCSEYLSCKEVIDLAEFFTFLSISFQFFIYKKFNNNFNDKFNVLKIKFKKIFSRKQKEQG